MTAAVVLGAGAIIAGSGPVSAATRAIDNSLVTVTTARWGAVATSRGSTPSSGSLQLTWIVDRGTAYQYLDVVNVGELALSGQSYAVTNVNPKNTGVKPPTVTFAACLAGSWSTTTHTCSGTVVPMGSTDTNTFTTLNTPLAPGARLEVQASTSPSANASWVTTINVHVARTQARAGITTSS